MASPSAPGPSPDPSAAAPDPGSLRLLRRLVTALLAVMIGGFVLIVAMFTIRLAGDDGPTVPDMIVLPDGVKAEAFTMGRGWYAVVTDDGRILIYDRASGALRKSVDIR